MTIFCITCCLSYKAKVFESRATKRHPSTEVAEALLDQELNNNIDSGGDKHI